MANVNGWHWQESDLLPYFKKTLTSMLGGNSIFSDGAGKCVLGDTLVVTGEAYCNLRKGKRILGYDVNVECPYKASVTDGDGNVLADTDGKLSIPYLSDENDADDTEITVVQDDYAEALKRIKQRVRKEGIPYLRKQLEEFLKRMKTEVVDAKTVVKQEIAPPPPPKKVEEAKVEQKPLNVNGGATDSKTSTGTGSGSSSSTSKASEKKDDADFCTIKSKAKFNCRPSDLFEVLTDQRRIYTFTRAPCEFEPSDGGKFMYLAGAISGKNISVSAPEKLVQEWRASSWPAGHHSRVEITITEKERGSTHLALVQTGVPRAEKVPTESGWTNYFWDRIHQVFGY
eukprot:TRINITY_DN26078_c0_g1_i1.p1 TRINITY_DN26078_c0_g1~~TRINITY_DN26078_c0_g1_i1.p1  ORF type:complete len:357 (-),score=97.57 TRINITY_DN26078_c0_g1_i1:56-1081(-)